MIDIATRKLHFIEEYLRIEDETLIKKLENLLNKERQDEKAQKPTAQDFLGLLGKEEADQMKKNIEDACENINQDDW